MKKDVTDRKHQVEYQLSVSRKRQEFARLEGDDRSAEIEGQVQDRLLAEWDSLYKAEQQAAE